MMHKIIFLNACLNFFTYVYYLLPRKTAFSYFSNRNIFILQLAKKYNHTFSNSCCCFSNTAIKIFWKNFYNGPVVKSKFYKIKVKKKFNAFCTIGPIKMTVNFCDSVNRQY